jgi:hypothetical protein
VNQVHNGDPGDASFSAMRGRRIWIILDPFSCEPPIDARTGTIRVGTSKEGRIIDRPPWSKFTRLALAIESAVPNAAVLRHFDPPWIRCMEFRLTYSAIAAPTASLISTVLG